MKNYLISIGGNSTSNVLSIERNFEEIIAVDSGVEHLFRLSLVPNTLIAVSYTHLTLPTNTPV